MNKIQIEDISKDILFCINKYKKVENTNIYDYNISMKSSKCERFKSLTLKERIKIIYNLLVGKNNIVYTNMSVNESDIKTLHQELIKLINQK